jgi:uncharacterized membrane protein
VDGLDKNLDANQTKRGDLLYQVWRLLSSFGYVFGGVLLLLGLYTYLYYETDWIGQLGLAFYPYRNSAIPIIIAGIVLMIVGYIAERRVREKTKGAGKTTTDSKH